MNSDILGIKYEVISKEYLQDDTDNFLYQLEKVYIVTDKIINSKEVKLLSKDKFWNPRVCARMKPLIFDGKLVFFDTVVSNENNIYYVDYLYIYNLNSNVLETYKSNIHINIYAVYEEGGNIYVIYEKNEAKLRKAIFNINTKELKYVCSQDECPEIKNFTSIGEKEYDLKFKEDRPYSLQVMNEENKTIFKLNKEQEIYYYLIK